MGFILGCNYWASNAGTEMWKQWSEEAVRDDFEILSSHGVEYLRVFPNWRDFQPVIPLFGGDGVFNGFLMEGDKAASNPYFLDEEMLDKFDRFCDLAEAYGLKLIVGLITGWMSGRLFTPPALYGKNLFTDAAALKLEQRFIKGFLNRFKSRKCIYAWDLGNECNCLGEVESRERADAWAMMISNAIRANDPTRPIISGMHGLDIGKKWNMFDQSESVDVFTTHPYPYFVPHCSEAKVTSVQTLLSATCQTKYYAELGNKPCLVEELGTLGPMICGDREAGDFLKVNLFSNWSNGATGVMWWCANEQIHLMFAPYINFPCETELGMINKHRKPRPVLQEMKKFSDWLKTLDFCLPKAEMDAVCLMSENSDNWGVAYSSYCLARQAGLNVQFAYANQGIPKADNYILPCVTSRFMSLPSCLELRKNVYEGATLYLSTANGIVPEFSEFTGLEVRNTETKAENGKFMIGNKILDYKRKRCFYLSSVGAEILAEDENGYPLFTRYSYGKGTVYFLNFPLETNLLGMCDGYGKNQHEIYRAVFADLLEKHIVSVDSPYIGVTHHMGEEEIYVVMINYSDQKLKTNVLIQQGYRVAEVIRGNIQEIEPFETVVFRVEQTI